MNIDYSLNELPIVAKQLLENLKSKTILLYGDMGVGKTTLIKEFVKALGSLDEVSSPTYSIVNEYELKDDKVFHFDLYRLKDLDEAYNIGIEDYLDSSNWIIIEWPELIEDLITDNYHCVYLSLKDKNTRHIILK
ncbi:tRNA (adenosine(37)-N6)-threonylcarbamoyltransferase complex ATPase subunit type 1 TsaE [Bizionia arctica]|uniref:tRNA (adenosine(37)-N6)-threonylcarbamoyltransferase complex ATPase subunit type 1 TsaE n=1 Tax=Bizionia arctica TaxID=1495645 RepID=UPI001E306FB2|nr:tRNA (adenosine(37)-N6)-threonylcarbamoyltransferase complex ATPase subunit type 1 TsaE [Bizionia arctica]